MRAATALAFSLHFPSTAGNNGNCLQLRLNRHNMKAALRKLKVVSQVIPSWGPAIFIFPHNNQLLSRKSPIMICMNGMESHIRHQHLTHLSPNYHYQWQYLEFPRNLGGYKYYCCLPVVAVTLHIQQHFQENRNQCALTRV